MARTSFNQKKRKQLNAPGELNLFTDDEIHLPEDAPLVLRGLLDSATDAALNRMADALGILAAQALGSYEVWTWVSWGANILRKPMIEALRRRIVEAVWNYAAEALGLQ